MTNNEILKADLLDILFEHRNKSYEAYTLRRYYNNRLLIALGIALSAVVLFFLMSLLNKSDRSSNRWINDYDNGVVLTQVELIQPKEPEQPQPKKPEPVAQRNFQTFKIVEDNKVNEPIADHTDLVDVAISNANVDGILPGNPEKGVTNEVQKDGTEKQEEKKEEKFEIQEMPPTFPGGPEALALFFSRTLSSPADLEPGEKKVILVRFVVGADGSIVRAEVIQSGGDSYDREVLRAFKRMPKWNPAIQNGIKVATSFTQPVTFIGLEQ